VDDVDLGDYVSMMKQQTWSSASLEDVPRGDMYRNFAIGEDKKKIASFPHKFGAVDRYSFSCMCSKTILLVIQIDVLDRVVVVRVTGLQCDG
jgi:hypothetical protein